MTLMWFFFILGHRHAGKPIRYLSLGFWLREGGSHPRYYSTYLHPLIPQCTEVILNQPQKHVCTSVLDCEDGVLWVILGISLPQICIQ